MPFTDGRVLRECTQCGQRYRPRVPDQKYCSPYCNAEGKKRDAKSARRVWVREGRPIINDPHDLRCGRTT
jgi:hypothetical protein